MGGTSLGHAVKLVGHLAELVEVELLVRVSIEAGEDLLDLLSLDLLLAEFVEGEVELSDTDAATAIGVEHVEDVLSDLLLLFGFHSFFIFIYIRSDSYSIYTTHYNHTT